MKYYVEVWFSTGFVRKFHFGQGALDYMEKKFSTLLREGRVKFFKIYPAA